jgi:hypothetical protein
MLCERRLIREDEAEVIRAALDRAKVADISEGATGTLSSLEVVSRCECGCASIDFELPSSDKRSTLLADGTATTPRGGAVGVIVWGRGDRISGLEIYDLGAGDDDLVLPLPTSIVPWKRGGTD